jgi:hypothetical protein
MCECFGTYAYICALRIRTGILHHVMKTLPVPFSYPKGLCLNAVTFQPHLSCVRLPFSHVAKISFS